MEKKLFILWIFLLSLLVSCGSTSNNAGTTQNSFDPSDVTESISKDNTHDTNNLQSVEHIEPMKTCEIYVNNVKIEQLGVYNNEDLFEIPILSVFKALGATLVWNNPQEAIVSYHEMTFTLDIGNKAIYREGNNVLLEPPGGGFSPVFRLNEQEIFVDHLMLEEFLRNEINLLLTWSHDLKEVYIVEV